MSREFLSTDSVKSPLTELTIRSMFDHLKERGILPTNMKILDFFYLLFPEEMVAQNDSVYHIIKSKNRGSNVFNRTYAYPNVADDMQNLRQGEWKSREWGADFYQNFGQLIHTYYGDVTAQCRSFLQTYACVSPASHSSVYLSNIHTQEDFSQLLSSSPTPYPCHRIDGKAINSDLQPSMEMNRFFNDCIVFLSADGRDELQELLTGNPYLSGSLLYSPTPSYHNWKSSPPNADELLAAIAIWAVFGMKSHKHFYALSLLPKHLQLLADEDYRCQELTEQSGFANNELSFFHNKWKTPLFLHTKHNTNVTLQKLYLPPEFAAVIYDRNSSNLLDLCLAPTASAFTREDDFYHRTAVHLLYVLGQPGIGKSSFVTYLIENLLYNPRGYEKVLVLSFKNLPAADLTREMGGLFGAIKKRAGVIDDSAFANTLIILDGFDEIRITNVDIRRQLIQDFEKLLTEDFFSSLGMKVILTSREGYLPLNDTGISGSYNALHLEPFSYEMITEYNARYNAACPGQPVQMLPIPGETREKDCEIYGIPIILYMVHGANLQISHIEDKNKLYDSLFSTENGRIYARDNSSGDSKYEREKILCYDAVACELAYRMFELGTGPAIQSYEERCLLWEKRIAPRLSALLKEMIAEKKTSLTEDAIPDCIASVRDSYVSFNYYYEGTYTEINSLEFVHKSIYEYYAGLYISRRLLFFLKRLTELKKTHQEVRSKLLDAFASELAGLFFHQTMSAEIRASLYYHLQKALVLRQETSLPPRRSRWGGQNQALPKSGQLTYANAYTQFHEGFARLLWNGIAIELNGLSKEKEGNLLVFPDFLESVKTGQASMEPAHSPLLSPVPEAYPLSETKADYLAVRSNCVLEQCLKTERFLLDLLYPTHEEKCAHRRVFSSSLAAALHSVQPDSGDWWPSTPPALCLDLSYCDLTAQNLSGLTLSHCDLEGANLTNCNLSGCDLSGVSFRNTIVSGANFTGAYLQRAELNGLFDAPRSHLKGCNFSRADLSYANLSHSNASACIGLESARFCHTNLGGLYLGDSSVTSGTDIRHCSKKIPAINGYFPEGRFFCYDMQNQVFRFPKGENIRHASIYLGHLPQNLAGDDKDTPVEWRVLRIEKENGRIYALLLSEYILDAQHYHQRSSSLRHDSSLSAVLEEGQLESADIFQEAPDPNTFFDEPPQVQWKDSFLYHYLNHRLLNLLFTPEEQKQIADRGFGRLFLCQLEDLEQTIEDEPWLKLQVRLGRPSNHIDLVHPGKGAAYWLHPVQNETLLQKAIEENTAVFSKEFSLSSGPAKNSAYCVYDDGTIRTAPVSVIGGIRPVMWYDITEMYT